MGFLKAFVGVGIIANTALALSINLSERGLKGRDTVENVLGALDASSICSSVVPIVDVTSTVTTTEIASTLEVTVTAPDCTVTGEPTATITDFVTETDTVTSTTSVFTTVTITILLDKRNEAQQTSTRPHCGGKSRHPESSSQYSAFNYASSTSYLAPSYPASSSTSSASESHSFAFPSSSDSSSLASSTSSTTSSDSSTSSTTSSTTSSESSTSSLTSSTTSSTTPDVTQCSIVGLPSQLASYACEVITAACTDLVQPQTITATEVASASTITSSTTVTNPCLTVTPPDPTELATLTVSLTTVVTAVKTRTVTLIID